MNIDNIRAVRSSKRADAWHGQYRLGPGRQWTTVNSAYGEIEYSTPEHAKNGADLTLKQLDNRG